MTGRERSWSLVYAELIELPEPMAQAIQILETACGMARQGVAVQVNARLLRPVNVAESLTPFLGPDIPSNLSVDPLFATQKGLAGLHYRARLFRRLIRAGSETVFFGRSRKHTAMLLRARRRLRSKARIFYEFHNIESEIARELGHPEKEERIRAEEREICLGCDGIVSISTPMAEDLRDMYGLAGTPAVVPDGVAADVLARKTGPPLAGERVNIVYAGSLYAYKGVDHLIEMLGYLPERFELTIVGGQGPEDLERLKRVATADERVASRVHFTGMVSPSTIGDWLGKADLICLPAGNSLRSTRYTSPLKLFEAMAAGVPVIAARVPALTSVLEHGNTGWIAADDTPKGLAVCAQHAAEHVDESRAVADRARELACSLNWDRRGEMIVDYVERTAARVPAGSAT